jgi:hypothetical protein
MLPFRQVDSLAYGCCALATANPSRGRRSSFDAITRRLGWAKTGKLYALSKHSLQGPDFFDSPSCAQVPGTRYRQLRTNDSEMAEKVSQKQGRRGAWCCGRGTERRLGSLDWHLGIGKAKRPRRLRDSSTHLRGRNAIAITTNFRACLLPRTAPIHPLPTTPLPAEANLARLPKRRWRRRFDIKMQCRTASETELLATGVP